VEKPEGFGTGSIDIMSLRVLYGTGLKNALAPTASSPKIKPGDDQKAPQGGFFLPNGLS
jgi:hypothetical protein